MALTAAQISYIRDMSGDDESDSDGAYLVPDATMQIIYDDTDQGNSDLDRTIVFVLRRMVGKTARKIGSGGQFQNEQAQQWHEHLIALLAQWEGRTGLGGRGIISAGVISLGLDEPCPTGVDCDD